MKFINIAIYFLIALSSCNSEAHKTSPQSTNGLIQRFKPFLNGVWVQADYMDAILKTKSPFKSSERLTFITELIIDVSEISADSTRVDIALGNHEGSDFILYFKQGKKQNSLLTSITDFEQPTDSYELGYEVSSNDTLLAIYHYDKNKKLLDKTNYIKVAGISPGSSMEDGFQYMVNKKLITGSYRVTDSAGIERSTRLTSEGAITGLPGFSTYYIITDFVASPEDNMDKICFDIQTDQQTCYAFEINRDTISLFKACEDETDTLFKKGNALYKFVKQF